MLKGFFTIRSLRGGLNNADPSIALADDQCVQHHNTELIRSMLGERRQGTSAVTLPAAITAKTNVSWLYRHIPDQDLSDAELWVGAFNEGPGEAVVISRKTTSWTSITVPDIANSAGIFPYLWSAASLHGKLFIAYDGAESRLHVVDIGATTLRKTGLATPSAPTAANDGGVGTFSGTRYYRVRMTVQSSGTTVRRSEPSTSLSFAPNGNDTGVVVTKPTTIEDATHWELEASKDDINFYVIATTAVGTATVTDTQDYAEGYAQDFDLSEDIGDYTNIWSAKFLATDEDRLLFAGNWENEIHGSTVGWTPVGAADGVGNDERYELDADSILDLDGRDGGPITAMKRAVAGEIWVFKFSRIYKLVRTGIRERAYEAIKEHDSMGALKNSAVTGADAAGLPCIYFLDPAIGPCRVGAGKIAQCGEDIRETWALLNLEATKVVCTGVYYPKNRQVIWNIATSGSNTPNLSIVLHVNESRGTDAGYRRGWVTWDGLRTQALATCLFSSNIEAGTARNHSLVPFIGGTMTGQVHLCDTGNIDGATAYAASITTKPYVLKTIATKFGVMGGYLVAKAVTGAKILMKVIADFGLETPTTLSSNVTFDAVGSETNVIKLIDDLVGSEMRTMQVQFYDPASAGTRFELNQLALIENAQQQN